MATACTLQTIGLKAGEAMDLTTGWDFNFEAHRVRARENIKRDKPLVVIGSPPCTAFSQLQTFNPVTPDSERKLKQAKAHVDFMVELYRMQIKREGCSRTNIPSWPRHRPRRPFKEWRKGRRSTSWRQISACTA